MALSGNIAKTVEQFNYIDRDVVAGAIQVYRGSMMNADASGNIKIAGDTASETFAGVSMVELNQDASASAGDNTVKLLSKNSGVSIKLKMTGATKASIGLKVYVKDDEEVQLVGDATNDVEVGTLVALAETNYVFVRL